MATIEQVDALLGELSEGEQRELLLRVADRLTRAVSQTGETAAPERFLAMCRDRPITPGRPTDAVLAVHEARDNRYGSR
jgi:hypothetical protein